MEVTERDMGSLRHMLGAIPGRYPKHKWGWRNYFLSGKAGAGHESMQRLVNAGLVEQGHDAGAAGMYYHATIKGCEAVGMSKAAIKRAFAP
jgi:hypothetical protein